MRDIIISLVSILIGGAITYVYFFKINKNFKKDIEEKFNRELLERDNRYTKRMEELEDQLTGKDNELKKSRREKENSEDFIDDSRFEVSQVYKENKTLKEKIEKLTLSMREYNMLYNSKKDELEKLRNHLKK